MIPSPLSTAHHPESESESEIYRKIRRSRKESRGERAGDGERDRERDLERPGERERETAEAHPKRWDIEVHQQACTDPDVSGLAVARASALVRTARRKEPQSCA
jgi:hypothetical protein